MKDPAFLFYSRDFYEGTRTMLPEERACYIDLMIYQHQNGIIPTDLKRVLLYCNGIDKATLEATLQAKFELTDKGWINRKLEKVTDERNEFTKKQSVNGSVGQFWKKSKAILNKKDYTKLRSILSDKTNAEILDLIANSEINEAMLKEMLLAKLKHLANEDANAIANKSVIIHEKEPEEKQIRFTIPPALEQVTDYCIERNNTVDPQRFINHYTSNGWMVGKNKMKDWQAAIRTWENKSNNYETNQRTNRTAKDYTTTRAKRN